MKLDGATVSLIVTGLAVLRLKAVADKGRFFGASIEESMIVGASDEELEILLVRLSALGVDDEGVVELFADVPFNVDFSLIVEAIELLGDRIGGRLAVECTEDGFVRSTIGKSGAFVVLALTVGSDGFPFSNIVEGPFTAPFVKMSPLMPFSRLVSSIFGFSTPFKFPFSILA